MLEKDKTKKELSEKQSENIIKQIAKNDYSLFELQGAYERWAKENSVQIDKTVKNYFLLSELRTDETKKEKQSVKILEKKFMKLTPQLTLKSRKIFRQKKRLQLR